MKKRYTVDGYFWNAKGEEYEHEEVCKFDSYEEAMAVYNVMKPTADLFQIEVWEEELNRYVVAERSTRIKLKDTSGEYDNPGLGE